VATMAVLLGGSIPFVLATIGTKADGRHFPVVPAAFLLGALLGAGTRPAVDPWLTYGETEIAAAASGVGAGLGFGCLLALLLIGGRLVRPWFAEVRLVGAATSATLAIGLLVAATHVAIG